MRKVTKGLRQARRRIGCTRLCWLANRAAEKGVPEVERRRPGEASERRPEDGDTACHARRRGQLQRVCAHERESGRGRRRPVQGCRRPHGHGRDGVHQQPAEHARSISSAYAAEYKTDLAGAIRVFPTSPGQPSTRIDGEIDFYLNGSLRWGIELLVNGDKIGEHMSRFAAGGKYAALTAKDYVIIDFRGNKRGISTKVARKAKRITAFFKLGDFSKCRCIFGFKDEELISLKQ